LPLGTFPRLRP